MCIKVLGTGQAPMGAGSLLLFSVCQEWCWMPFPSPSLPPRSPPRSTLFPSQLFTQRTFAEAALTMMSANIH